MTVPVQTGAAGFLARYEGLKDHLPGARKPWLNALRADAAAHFAARGFPTRRIEQWKYTDLAPLAQASFAEPLTMVDGTIALPPAHAPHRAVFVDGRFRADLSTLDGLAFGAQGLAQHLNQAEVPLGALAKPDSEPLTALNTMLFEDGLFLDVPAGVDGGLLELISVAVDPGRPFAFHPRHLLRLGAGARLTLIETAIGAGTCLHNPVFEIDVAEGATLTHGRMLQEAATVFHLSTIYARIAAEGTYDNFTVAAGPRLTRNEIHAALVGPRAACHMNGAQMASEGQHVDTTTSLDHAAPDCASRQTYKTVLAGRSRGVFQGKILVRREAQKTDGYQMNQALLLSEDAEIDSKPQLEIYADDVKCSHGATVGALDPDSLFYLRARGIPEAQAKAMLVEAFLHEAVETVTDETLRGALTRALDAWWARQGAPTGAAA
ncbi:Fe-S cluster assembly protein SufD [Roseomonas fluvialis]|uniref:Fe-S cluster assembly protein SufD n=1 Tax=Roseomonas fluvialis TaxID=1750527 RepID=A0ABN6P0F3_9PROT|nr:Fe-S cluster assembly protein SufD [Roseomonas fluvialis]BDG71307.1 Fe-S cluster assembly protein SufD [Roseomonas fluvialis]